MMIPGGFAGRAARQLLEAKGRGSLRTRPLSLIARSGARRLFFSMLIAIGRDDRTL
jgi:hypothetical protein